MAWFKDGTITVTNGSKAVTLSGASTTNNIYAGDALVGPDGKDYEIASVGSGTTFQLVDNYAGATASGAAYKVKPIAVVDTLRQASATLASVTASYQAVRDNQGQGLFTDLPLKPRLTDNSTTFKSHLDLLRGAGTGTVASLRSRGDGAHGVDYFDIAFDGASRVNVSRNGDLNVIGADASTDAILTQNRPTSVVGSYLGRQSAFGYDSAAAYRQYGQRQFEIQTNTAGAFSGRHAIIIAKSAGLQYAEILTGDEHRLTGAAPYYSLYNQAGTTRLWYAQHDGSVFTMVADVGFIKTKASVAGGYVHSFSAVNNDTVAAFEEDHSGAIPAVSSPLRIAKHSTNGRSISGTGTFNASGSDQAEYQHKAIGCGAIGKGQVVGLNADDEIVDTWATSIRFKLKSTDPHSVGGDRWHDDLGERPERPGAFVEPAYTGRIRPEEGDPLYDLRLVAWQQDQEAYAALIAAGGAAHEEAIATYEAEDAAWLAAFEERRATVDRLAYSGRVPAIVEGPISAGDYVLAAADGEDIKAICVETVADGQRRYLLGRVAIAGPTEAQLRRLLGNEVALDPAWTAIIDVMQG